MTDKAGTDALDQALALHASPGRSRLLRERPLAGAVLQLIRIAGGDRAAIESAADRTAETPQRVIDAAALYIQQVLFHDGADSYRMLGVRPDAGDDTIKEHYRWLMHWLHPDRNPERWEVAYSERVNRAWNSLNSGQRRNDYDAYSTPRPAEQQGVALIRKTRHAKLGPSEVPYPHSVLSPQAISKVPPLVLGGLTATAMVLLVLMYLAQREQSADATASAGNAAAPALEDNANPQEAVIRRRIAFDEHVIEMSQPDVPRRPPAAQPVPVESTGTASAVTPADSENAGNPVDESAAATAPPEAAAVRSKHDSSMEHQVAKLPEQKPDPPPSPFSAMASLPFPRSPRSERPIRTAAPLPEIVTPKPVAASAIMPTTGHEEAVPAAIQAKADISMSPQAALNHRSGHHHAEPVVVVAKADFAMQPQAAPDNAVAASVAYGRTMSGQEATATLPREFAAAYARGDLDQMLRLFAPTAVDNRGGLDAITEDYQRLFHDTSSRDLSFNSLKWAVRSDRIVGTGAFQTSLQRRDERFARHVHGWIQIEAIPIDGRWKIQRIVHRNAE